jgi:hypothetical protein
MRDRCSSPRRVPRATMRSMNLSFRPFTDQSVEIDGAACLIDAIARMLDEQIGGNPVLNRLEAEAHVHRFTMAAGKQSPSSRTSTPEEVQDA